MEEEIGLEEHLLPEEGPERPRDPRQAEAEERLAAFFEKHREAVFFSKQIEVINENDFYHWLTNRALKKLVRGGLLRSEPRQLRTGTTINLLWHNKYRYQRRAAAHLMALVNEYADPNVGGALGLHGEAMVLEGFARHQFVMRARDVNEFGGRKWPHSEHNLDFVFERDGRLYGIEVKNTIKYIGEREFEIKTQMCHYLGLTPIFVCRMLPRSWILDLVHDGGGFALVLKWQLYPWTHAALAKRVHRELGLPVDSPKRLADGTMQRFVGWHTRRP